jgi:hypothetical protein
LNENLILKELTVGSPIMIKNENTYGCILHGTNAPFVSIVLCCTLFCAVVPHGNVRREKVQNVSLHSFDFYHGFVALLSIGWKLLLFTLYMMIDWRKK